MAALDSIFHKEKKKTLKPQGKTNLSTPVRRPVAQEITADERLLAETLEWVNQRNEGVQIEDMSQTKDERLLAETLEWVNQRNEGVQIEDMSQTNDERLLADTLKSFEEQAMEDRSVEKSSPENEESKKESKKEAELSENEEKVRPISQDSSLTDRGEKQEKVPAPPHMENTMNPPKRFWKRPVLTLFDMEPVPPDVRQKQWEDIVKATFKDKGAMAQKSKDASIAPTPETSSPHKTLSEYEKKSRQITPKRRDDGPELEPPDKDSSRGMDR